jgi:hypothetical protein
MGNHDVEQMHQPHTRFPAFWFSVVCALARRPQLWSTALRQLTRLSVRRWWSRPPFLPIPPRAYVRFRLETAYGAHATPRPLDVIRYLEWCRDVRRSRAA